MSNTTMQAIQAQDYGGPEVLVLEQAPRPEPNADQVLIQLKASGVNPADWKYRSGVYKQFMQLQFPWTPGMEGSGVVEAVGENITTLKKGDEVYGIVTGGYAEYALALENDVQLKPAGLTFEQAAALPVGVLTAWGAVIDTAKVEAGQRVLVHGAAGGVGAYAVQLARWKGAHVTGTASADNLEFVRSLGTDKVIDYNATRFETVLKDMDAVIDTVGGDLPERSFQVIRPGGIFVTVAARLSEDAGKAQNMRATGAGRASTDTLKKVSELIEARQLKPVTGVLFPLAEARQAHELSQVGHGHGRIILQIGNGQSN
ncbi:MAG TPA: NADP-dependent oxidoreductase [Anaerolineales bacterium]|nr:NADP-dependent oxidoreductase [Anaerolineales bacterium]